MDRWSWPAADENCTSRSLYLAVWVILFFFLNLIGSLGVEYGFVTKGIEIDGKHREYWLYIPPSYDPEQEWPMIVFLHGLLQWGNGNVLALGSGIGPAIQQHPDLYQCLVLFPQVCFPQQWRGQEGLIGAEIEKTIQEYSVDTNRICLTGLSTGGITTWMYGADRVDFFAALVPVSGYGRLEDAEALAQVPIWAFNGSRDCLVDPSRPRALVEAVRAAGGTVHYTEYPDLTHFNTWDRAYNDPEVIDWMLTQSRAN